MKNGMLIEKPTKVPEKTYTPMGCLVALHLYPARPLASGLVMPETAAGTAMYEAQRCLVIAKGPDCKWCEEGDEVLCVQGASKIIHNGHTTYLVREDNLVGVVVEEHKVERRSEVPA